MTVVTAIFTATKSEAAQLKLGVAREIITPKLGGLFLGYGSDKGSTAVHDDLTVTAFAFEYGETKAVLMSVSICLIGNEMTAKLQTLCGEAAGVPPSHIILSATHTHSGPYTANWETGEDREYCDEIFVPKCVAAAKAAVQDMKPVTMGIATTETKVGVNRRQILANDSVILGQNPWGIYDSTMTVISFKDENGKPVANMIHCSAHSTGAGNNTEVTRDWSGPMVDRLEEETGAITAFFNGLNGDLAPRVASGGSVGNITQAMEVGAVGGIDAVRAYNDINDYRNEDMSVATGVVRLPHAPLIPLEEARAELAKLEANTQARFTATNVKVLKANIEAYEKGETGESFFTYDQALVRIGPVVFVPVPFEASTEISLRLRAYSKYAHTLGLGNANGSNSYLPTRDQITRGGYEIDRFKWSGARKLADNADWHLINQNLELMEKL